MNKFLGMLILFLFPTLLQAQCTGSSRTWTSTLDQASLQTCANKASAGDTINVTGATVTWNTGNGIIVKKALTIICSGTCVINDALQFSSTGRCELFSFSGGTPGSLTRLSGFTMLAAGGNYQHCSVITAAGNCNLTDCTYLRLDNNIISGFGGICCAADNNSYGLTAIDDMFGVIDHNTVTSGSPGNYSHFSEINHATFPPYGPNNTENGEYGDSSWAQPEYYGSSRFMFFEDNTFTDTGCCETEGGAKGIPWRGGTRVVVRHNTFNVKGQYSTLISWHGTESGGRPRGGRTFEFYDNTVYFANDIPNGQGANCLPGETANYFCANVVSVRSGTGIAWGNTFQSSSANFGGFGLNDMRHSGPAGTWNSCDGTATIDSNDSNARFTGTAIAVSLTGGLVTVTFSGPAWTTNQWIPAGAPYSVHDVTKTTSTGYDYGSEISSNTANSVSYQYGGPGSWLAAVGDTIEITRSFWCMDTMGRGAGKYYSYTSYPTTSSFNVPSGEVSSPSYFWMNSFTDQLPSNSFEGVFSNSGKVTRNREFYAENTNQAAQSNAASPFNGQAGGTGIGHGTLANRPTTCVADVGLSPSGTRGQAYAETDSSGNFIQLDWCIATNTWSTLTSSPASYVPYTYPHPLSTGASVGPPPNPPNPPTGLVVTIH